MFEYKKIMSVNFESLDSMYLSLCPFLLEINKKEMADKFEREKLGKRGSRNRQEMDELNRTRRIERGACGFTNKTLR